MDCIDMIKNKKTTKSMICGLLSGNDIPFRRGGQTRTDDLLVPNQAYYQTVLHPENNNSIKERLSNLHCQFSDFCFAKLCGERGIRTPGTVTRTAV